MALGLDMLHDAAVELADVADPTSVPSAVEALARRIGEPALAWSTKTTLGLVLLAGLSLREEVVLDSLGNLTDISFVGGSAADDGRFVRTSVFANGRAASNAAVLAVLKPRRGFSVLKTQSVSATSRFLTATKVDEGKRTVLEFDGQPVRGGHGIDP